MDRYRAGFRSARRGSASHFAGSRRFERTLAVIESLVGVSAMIAGALMVIRPDGSLLSADVDVLKGTPFQNWTVPGLLLAVLVGGGFLAACAAEFKGASVASTFSIAAGTGLVAFEIVQFALIGWHPLQPVMMVTGFIIVLLATLRSTGQPLSSRFGNHAA